MSTLTYENKNKLKDVKQYDVWFADLGESNGHVQGGKRPVLVISNDVGNQRSPVVIVAPITSSKTKNKLPTQVHISAEDVGFQRDSIIQFEQIFTLSKDTELIGNRKLTHIPEEYHDELEKAWMISMLGNKKYYSNRTNFR
ncbi:type II toxin-antitoxin system PemK/MazF family toxin [Paenibacillus sophorae]|nr:type II toxin-antitoxin system PemK/MazF family toxin [Paenibacillus sophorae]QWU14351.1 type II toxin-antitoxin system PemK/MazF family toxin [Paenibacillus sophorae]